MSAAETHASPPAVAEPCTVVIFGAGGDLTKRKLLPALCNLAGGAQLPESLAVVGVIRGETTHEAFRDRMDKDIHDKATHAVEEPTWEWLRPRIYVSWGDLSDAATYSRLAELLAKVDAERGTKGNAVFYLSTPPQLIGTIIAHLGKSGLVTEEGGRFRRVIVEKPFGRDLESAKTLNAEIGKTLAEKQIYRIDHYLGKETVQNIIIFRFANGLFEPLWNHNYIDAVQITVSEAIGIEGRGKYYEESGALRDMVANHLFQLLSLIAMEPPISFEADAVRDEKVKVLRAITPLSPEEVLQKTVRGQYQGYRAEPNVARESGTETYVAMKLQVDSWRWAGVPFYLRTGKKLGERATRIVVQFKRAPFVLFRSTDVGHLNRNVLVINIQPKEGISLRFGAKVPGTGVRLANVDMAFDYAQYFGAKPQTGYETLLFDSMVGDQTLFQRADMVEVGWAVTTAILDVWSSLKPRNFPNYTGGAEGPKEADELLARDGRTWWKPER